VDVSTDPGDVLFDDDLGRVLATVRTAPMPPALHEALIEVFHRRDSISCLTARITHDGAVDPPAPGLRSARVPDERQMTFTGDGIDVLVAVTPSEGNAERFEVRGQVLADDDGFVVQMLLDGREAALVTCDELGEFGIDGLHPGRYELVVAGPRVELGLSVVPVG
jgi:hypothetical protein